MEMFFQCLVREIKCIYSLLASTDSIYYSKKHYGYVSSTEVCAFQDGRRTSDVEFVNL